jgi:ATP-dependent helicase/nuclease subunit A
MTRAEKWLIVAAAGDVGEGDDSWYNIVSDGMKHAGDIVEGSGDRDIRRVPHMDWQGGDLMQKTVSEKAKVPRPHFGDLPEITQSQTLSPSDLGGAKVLPGDPGTADKDEALARGSMIHLLLEHLPLVPVAQRQTIGERLLAGQSENAFDTDLVDQVTVLLSEPTLAHIFTELALTEVDVTAAVPDLQGRRIHGAIDRLIINGNDILAIDYKTNRLVPDTPENVPDGLLRQMGAYRAALDQIFPDHQIRTAILWTETANLMELPAALTVHALAQVTQP